MVTYEDVADAAASQASLAETLAPRMGRTVAVHFCAPIPPKVGVLSNFSSLSLFFRVELHA